MLTDLKRRLGISEVDISQDGLLEVIIKDAQAFFKDYCNRDDIPDGAESVIGRLAVLLYNRNAEQYKQSVSVGAYSSTNYTDDDIPKSIRIQLKPYRKVKFA